MFKPPVFKIRGGMYLWKRPPLGFKYWVKYNYPYKDRIFDFIVKPFWLTALFAGIWLPKLGWHVPLDSKGPEWRGEGWLEDYTEDGRFKSDVRKKNREL